jgi:hypothetical protein
VAIFFIICQYQNTRLFVNFFSHARTLYSSHCYIWYRNMLEMLCSIFIFILSSFQGKC